jgi:hypothetical protein
VEGRLCLTLEQEPSQDPPDGLLLTQSREVRGAS